jgi:hypothetical protein
MKMEMWTEENVSENGDIKNDMNMVVAKMSVTPFFAISLKSEAGSKSHNSKNHFIQISFGRDEDTSSIMGINIIFDSREEMYNVLAAPFFGGLSSN